jgi:hypothetical protein
VAPARARPRSAAWILVDLTFPNGLLFETALTW